MSYYMFTDKKFIRLSNEKILPLCMCADSSVTNRTGGHPKSWMIFMHMPDSLFVTKEYAMEKQKEAVNIQLQRLQEFNDEFCDGEKIGSDLKKLPNYYGNTYNGKRSVEAMRLFYSVRQMKDAYSFFKQFFLEFQISVYDRYTFSDRRTKSILVRNENQLIQADAVYADMEKKKAENEHICIGVERIEYHY